MDRMMGLGVFLNESEQLHLLDLVRSLATCEDQEQFLGCLRSSQPLLFFDNALACLVAVDADGVVQQKAPLNLNFPPAFVDGYLKQDLDRENPFMKEVIENGTPCFWREVALRKPPGDGLTRLLEEFHFQNGCSHGFFSPKGRVGSYFSFQAAWLRGPDPRFTTLLTYLTPFLHQGLCRVHRVCGQGGGKRPLSKREAETLRWVRAGKNTWETSQILGVSQNTVKFHLKNAMVKLGAANRSHAVALAIGMGVLDD